MGASGPKTLPTIAFLTVIENNEWGFTGGLLILNLSGRPVEFHCTAPLKPNRAQEILYGPTLRPFLYGEQIGQTLISKVKSEPLFVCTNVEPALCVRSSIETPVLLVREPVDPTESSSVHQGSSSSGTGSEGNSTIPTRILSEESRTTSLSGLRNASELNSATSIAVELCEFSLGSQSVAVLNEFAGDREFVVRSFQQHQHPFNLAEPFGRIREALDEAQRGAAK